MLLAVVCQKLVNLCETVVNKYQQQIWRSQGVSKEAVGKSPGEGTVERHQKIVFGKYTVDLPSKWDPLERAHCPTA